MSVLKSHDFGTTIKATSGGDTPGGEVGDNSPPTGEEPDASAIAGSNPIGDNATGKHRARRRAPRSLGPDPFLELCRAYLRSIQGFYRQGSLQRMKRNLQTIHRDLTCLREEGGLSTVNPKKFTQDDISKLLYHWQTRPSRYSRPLDTATVRKYIADLNGLLEWAGNGVIDTMRRRKIRLPRAIEKPIRVLSDGELERLRAAAKSLHDPWWCRAACLMVALLPCSGLRRKEFRTLRLEDLDNQRWRILVSHPKGEGSWAAPDYAYVAPSARSAVLKFLEERKRFLRGQRHEALVPYRHQDGRVTYWSDGMLGKLKGELECRSGVKFSIKTFRPTFAQAAKDNGAPIEAVSRALRHKDTRTTERYYARIRADDAFSELDKAFNGGSN